MKSKWIEASLMALWPPMIWASFLVLDIFTMGGERPKFLVFRILEDLLFVFSFLLYRVRGANEGISTRFFWPAAIQFFFWWAISLLVILLYRWSVKKRL